MKCLMCGCQDEGAVDICRACYNEKAVVATFMRNLLLQEARQLEQWANESESGGWSTHQVKSMRERAEHIRARIDFIDEIKVI